MLAAWPGQLLGGLPEGIRHMSWVILWRPLQASKALVAHSVAAGEAKHVGSF